MSKNRRNHSASFKARVALEAIKMVYGTLIRSAARWQRVTMNDIDLTILRNLKKTVVGDLESDDERISYLIAA